MEKEVKSGAKQELTSLGITVQSSGSPGREDAPPVSSFPSEQTFLVSSQGGLVNLEVQMEEGTSGKGCFQPSHGAALRFCRTELLLLGACLFPAPPTG